jgi:2,4-dienoyl-CoA reductase-like NADH-dependent reductase (Old Yellow Enzyme family)
VPEDFSGCLPYRYAFGVNAHDPLQYDLTETFQFVELCGRLGVKIVNVSGGSPYYNPHLQRPAAYPPSDGYQPPEDPLVGVARQIQVARQVKARAPQGLLIVGSAYTYLQEFLPQVAQAVVRAGWTDLVGVGRMVLSYPSFFADVLRTGRLEAKRLCRTFSDCTTAPRNGFISGCYPLDKYYANRPEARKLKEIKGK